MRSIFWRILGAFWLALFLTGLLTFFLTSLFNQDSWILSRHPGVSDINQGWLEYFSQQDLTAAQQHLHKKRIEYRIDTQVFDADGKLVSASGRMRIPEPKNISAQHSNWRRLTMEITADNGESYLFVYRINKNELAKWLYGHGLGPLLLIIAAFLVLAVVSLLLTASITRPLTRLRKAVHELGETAYQQKHLSKLAERKDELGVLAADFNKMGQRLQDMLKSQRQLLRDVSHELRSPLARLQVGLAIAERGDEHKRQQLWPKLQQECERLERLIDEILVLARLQQEAPEAESFDLCALLKELKDDCQLLQPEQSIHLSCSEPKQIFTIKNCLHRALDNILRNALRFNPYDKTIDVQVDCSSDAACISIRDNGPGVSAELLDRLTTPFVRGQNQAGEGYGLGLTITQKSIDQLGGKLLLDNHPDGGFLVKIKLPIACK